MKQILTDELLQEAARKVQNAMLNSLPEDDGELPEPSLAFEKKTEQLMRQFKKREQRRKFLHCAAACFLAILVGLSGWLALDTEARASVSRWIREIFENTVYYRFFAADDSSKISTDYSPQWLPEGYKTEKIQQGYSQKIILYSNGENQITFICNMADTGAENIIIGEDFQLKEVHIGDYSGDFYEEISNEEPNALIWVDVEAEVVFSIFGALEEEAMLQIAESVILNNE